MLLQKLTHYAENRLSLPPPMYQEQAVRYRIALADDGRYLGCFDTADPKVPAAKNGERCMAPHVKRAYAIKPKLLADTGIYALGLAGPDAKPDRVAQQHDAFVALVEHCATTTGERSVNAVATFLRNLDTATLDLPADFNPSATLTFRVGELYPIDLPPVRAYWAGLQAPEEGGGATSHLTCIVCGRSGPTLERHPLKIKGIPGGQIVKDLISANAGAFESYGLRASLTAPTCQSCAEAYGNALNDLLANELTRIWVSGLAYAFWTEQPAGISWAPVITKPEANEAEVKQLLASYRTGRAAAVDLDPMPFYAVALGASGARVVVRDWLDTTVGEAKRRLGRYFALQELVDPYGEPGMALSLARIGNSTVRDPRKEEPPPLVPRSLLRLAFAGDPLPLDLLFLAVRRNRADQNVTRERAMLIKMVFGSQPSAAEGEESTMSDLDLANREPAYLCGRLLATLDVIQQRALGNPNATIIDKFYGTASSAPASVFGTLMHGAQAHMGKLRRDHKGTFNALEEQLEIILEPLETFPTTLTLQDQGLFALGFYHQRAANRRAARERRELRDQGVQPQE